MTMTPLPAPQFCLPSPPTSFWPGRAAPETPAQSCFSPMTFGKIYARIAQIASSPHVTPSNTGAKAQNRRPVALTAVFKSP